MFVSFDDGDNWQPLQLNLPVTSMRDFEFYGNDLIVATHGRGFWVIDDISPLRQVNDAVIKSDAYLFKPADAINYNQGGDNGTPLQKDEPQAPNPPNGAMIDYYLKSDATGPVTLEILDATGTVRQAFTTDAGDGGRRRRRRTRGVWRRTRRRNSEHVGAVASAAGAVLRARRNASRDVESEWRRWSWRPWRWYWDRAAGDVHGEAHRERAELHAAVHGEAGSVGEGRGGWWGRRNFSNHRFPFICVIRGGGWGVLASFSAPIRFHLKIRFQKTGPTFPRDSPSRPRTATTTSAPPLPVYRIL